MKTYQELIKEAMNPQENKTLLFDQVYLKQWKDYDGGLTYALHDESRNAIIRLDQSQLNTLVQELSKYL